MVFVVSHLSLLARFLKTQISVQHPLSISNAVRHTIDFVQPASVFASNCMDFIANR